MIPIFTLDTNRLVVLVRACSGPCRLARLQWHASHPLPRIAHPSSRLRHADLGREVGAERELAHEAEVVRIPRLPRLDVDPAQQLLARRDWQRGEPSAGPLVA